MIIFFFSCFRILRLMHVEGAKNYEYLLGQANQSFQTPEEGFKVVGYHKPMLQKPTLSVYRGGCAMDEVVTLKSLNYRDGHPHE